MKKIVATLTILTVMFGGVNFSVGAEEDSFITVVQESDPVQGFCLPALLALTNKVSSSDDTFVITVTASAPLCSAVKASAVIYSMPGGGVAWPQELFEVVPFTIKNAGVTEITFKKDCNPVQFDVVTGETPQTISPISVWHGPMLFPVDLSTAQQHWGFPCPPPTTTTTASTTTTSTTIGTTTTSTTIGTTTTTQVPVQLAPELLWWNQKWY
jgi:hypothetical protein